MDTLLIIAGAICVVLALIGTIAPFLPGLPLAYLGIILLHITDIAQFSLAFLITWAIVIIFIQVIDYLIPMWGTKHFGGSKYGNRGCLVGTIAGIFFFPPWGLLLGPFLGAVIGEIIAGNEIRIALKAGVGSFVGFIAGTILNFAACAVLAFFFVKEAFF